MGSFTKGRKPGRKKTELLFGTQGTLLKSKMPVRCDKAEPTGAIPARCSLPAGDGEGREPKTQRPKNDLSLLC